MSIRILATVFALGIASNSVEAAPIPLIKGEWIVMDQTIFTTRLNLKADGSGELVNDLGASPISWSWEGGSIRMKLLQPLFSRGLEYEEEQEYQTVTTLLSLTLDFKKFEGLDTIIWTMTSQSQTTYPSHPEKASKDLVTVRENTRLVAGRQFINFAPRQGQTLGLTLPDYFFNPDELYPPVAPSLVVRLDPANVVTLVEAPANLGVSSLYWTLDHGSLRISDGKGYTVRYKLFKGDGVAAHLLADIEKGPRHVIADDTAVHTNEVLRATGFQANSQIFQGCWSAFEPKTTYCFPSDRHFSFTSNDPEFGSYTAYGLWRIENARIVVDRYRSMNGPLLEDREELLACERELADASLPEKSCELFQTRSYALLNEDKDQIGVYRILSGDDYTSTLVHVMKR